MQIDNKGDILNDILWGRNELDDRSRSDPTGHIVAIPLVTGTITDFRARGRRWFIHINPLRSCQTTPAIQPTTSVTHDVHVSDV